MKFFFVYSLIWIAGQHCFHMSSHNSQIFTFFADFPVVMFCSNCLGIEQSIQKKECSPTISSSLVNWARHKNKILTNYILITGHGMVGVGRCGEKERAVILAVTSHKSYHQNFLLSCILQILSSIYVYSRFKAVSQLSAFLSSIHFFVFYNTKINNTQLSLSKLDIFLYFLWWVSHILCDCELQSYPFYPYALLLWNLPPKSYHALM